MYEVKLFDLCCSFAELSPIDCFSLSRMRFFVPYIKKKGNYIIIKYNAVTWLCNNLFYSYCKPMLRKSSMRQIDELGYLCRILATKYEGLEASILCGRLCEVSLFDVVVLPFIYLKFTDSVMYDFCWLHMMQLWGQDSLTSRTGGHTIFVIFLLEPVIPLTLSHCSHSQPLCLLSW